MVELAKQIDDTLNRIILKSENQLELLVGQCQSQVSLTNTQEHILMLLGQGQPNNSDLAKALNVSQAAITKAVKSLKEQGMIKPVKEKIDGRKTYYRLTRLAKPIAEEHAHHHNSTLAVYEALADLYLPEEQAIIQRFLTDLLEKIEGKT